MSIAAQLVSKLLESDIDPKSVAMRTKPLRLNYVISGEPDGEEQLFWSNRYGWTGLFAATRFKQEEVTPDRMPLGATGVWQLINGKLGEKIR